MKVVKLFAPENYADQPCSYFNADEELINTYTNGCGSGSNEKYVKDKLLGLSVKPACLIHDWMYTWGESNDDKQRADIIFLNNMVRIIKAQNSLWIVERIRLYLARVYYKAVKYLGGPYFWANKNDEELEYREVPLSGKVTVDSRRLS